MDNIIYKDCKITDINKDDKTLVVVASDETIDRYKEVMIAKGCKYGDYIPFLWAHNRSETLPPIGRVLSVNKRNNKVKTKVQFADTEFADSINRLYTSDPPMMEKVSVGFITEQDRDPDEDEKKKGIKRVIEKWELLEVSAVPIPANPNAGTERDREMRTKIKDAVDSGEIQLPEMVYKDFGFKEEEDVIQSNTGSPKWEKVEEILDEGLRLEPEVEEKLLEEFKGKIEKNDTKETLKKIQEDREEIEKHAENIERVLYREIEEKPMENFHVCEINTKKYPKYRLEKCPQKHNGKCIDVNWGILASNKSEISSLRYDIKIWTKSSAQSHCKSRKGRFIAATKDAQEEEIIDYLNIVEPQKDIVKFKESPNIELENVAQNEGITDKQIDESVDRIGKKFVDSLRRAFRRDYLGIVDDEK